MIDPSANDKSSVSRDNEYKFVKDMYHLSHRSSDIDLTLFIVTTV